MDPSHEIVLKNQGLVVEIAQRLGVRPRHSVWRDALQEGSIALLQAARRFDPERGTKFSTFAWSWVANAVKRALCAQQLVHEPVKRIARRAAAKSAHARLSAAERETTPDPGPVHAEVVRLPETLISRDTEDDLIDGIQRDRLARKMRKLPRRQREAVAAALRGDSMAAHARSLGVSRGATDYRLRKGLEALGCAHLAQSHAENAGIPQNGIGQ